MFWNACLQYINISYSGLVLIGIILALLYKLGKRRNLPPGPFAWPIVGNTTLMRRDPYAYKNLTALAEKYGCVYRFYCGSTIIVMLNGFDVIREAFVKQADVFTDRPQLHVPLIGVSKGTGLTYNSGQQWKELRRFALQALRDFGIGKLTLEERIKDELKVVMATLKESEGQPIRIKPHLLSAATNIICSVMFGARFEYNEPKFNELTGVLEAIFRLNAPFAKENFFPVTRLFPSGRKLIKQRGAAIERVKRYLAETITEHETTFDPDNVRDFIDLYLRASRDQSNPELFTEMNIYKIIVDLFLAGGETTGTSLDWSLLYMISFPDIQAKCQQEIDKVVGTARSVCLSDRGKLPYVEATLLEIQRIANTLAFALPHVANSDTTLQGFDIPKGAIVIANLYSANMDLKYWENPSEFRPDRFLNDEGNLLRKEAWIPFSTGPRLCIGEPLARMELFLFFTNLIQQFQFSKASENEATSLEGINALTLTPLPYDLRVQHR